MLLTYDEYTTLDGTLPVEVFEEYAPKAESYVNFYTFNRIVTPTRSVQEAIKEIIDYLYEVAEDLEMKKNAMSGIKSETSGSYRVEYAQPETAAYFLDKNYQQIVEDRIRMMILRWLGHTGLMYRGLP